MSSQTDDDDEIFVKNLRQKIESKSFKPTEPQSINTPDWRNPDDVKAYLDNLFVEYNFQCVSEKLPDGCHRLANFLENIRQQYKEATAIYKKNCDDNKHPRSCSVYAKNCSLGRGIKQDLLEACRYSFIACDLGVRDVSCLNAGMCWLNGVGGLPVDVNGAVDYLNRACDEQNPMACIRLFKLYIEGKTPKQTVYERHPAKAFDYARRACEMNDIIGCLNASLMCRKGIYVYV